MANQNYFETGRGGEAATNRIFDNPDSQAGQRWIGTPGLEQYRPRWEASNLRLNMAERLRAGAPVYGSDQISGDRYGDLSQQSARDAFYNAPLTALEVERSVEGERALGERVYTEYMLARDGFGESAYTTSSKVDMWKQDQRDTFQRNFRNRGRASAFALDRAGRGEYREFSRIGFVEPAGGYFGGGQLLWRGTLGDDVKGITSGSELSSRRGTDGGSDSELLFSYQNVSAIQRQRLDGIDRYPTNAINRNSDFIRPNTIGSDTDPPVNYNAAAIEQRQRSNRRSIGAASRGRGGRGNLASGSKGLLNELEQAGARTLGG